MMADTFSPDIEHFIKHFLKELNENNAAIFAGAGLSISAGYVDWKTLLKPLAEELTIDIEKESDLVSLAQYYFNAHGRNRLSQHLLDEIGVSKTPTKNHEVLARLPIPTYWTTNYDKLIEKSLENVGKIVDRKYTVNQLAITKKGRNAILYKMHGDIENTDVAVITKDDYEKYTQNYGPFVNALSGDLISKTFLFLGFSFTDPNLDYVMSRIRITFKEHQRQHYCIFRRCARDDFEHEEDYLYAVTKQQLVINDLKRFSIKTLLVDHYDEITSILERIEDLYRRRTIFFSGSAHEYGVWKQSDVEKFLSKLGEILIEKKFKIASGIGLGIGNALITGAIKSVYVKLGGNVSEYLTMRPFPQFIEDNRIREETWEKYRNEIISFAGIAIFFMGNKLDGGRIVDADGVKKEFEIAHKLGLLLIPVGASGYMAKGIWDIVMTEIDKYYPNAPKKFIDGMKGLGEKVEEPDKLISKIINVIELATK
ncbi:SIR2 family protein [Pseudoalteromonas piscicida]|uniref:SIR2 family protein n=1 Tax=Pseudoalteromonas piscicida TaxID=43662 RepID=UPI0030C90A36